MWQGALLSSVFDDRVRFLGLRRFEDLNDRLLATLTSHKATNEALACCRILHEVK